MQPRIPVVVCEVMDEEVYEGTEEMTNDADAAVKLLQHNLELIKKSAEARNRPNLKQQIEECQALLRIIVKFVGTPDEVNE